MQACGHDHVRQCCLPARATCAQAMLLGGRYFMLRSYPPPLYPAVPGLSYLVKTVNTATSTHGGKHNRCCLFARAAARHPYVRMARQTALRAHVSCKQCAPVITATEQSANCTVIHGPWSMCHCVHTLHTHATLAAIQHARTATGLQPATKQSTGPATSRAGRSRGKKLASTRPCV